MDLKQELAINVPQAEDRTLLLYKNFGVAENPFPSAGQPSGHPHMETPADQEVVRRLVAFVRDLNSQVMLVVGTQGTGKSNLLWYYEQQLRHALRDQAGYYVIRYFADPEPSFDAVLRRLLQELGPSYLLELRKLLLATLQEERQAAIEEARGFETRTMFGSLLRCNDDRKEDVARAAVEWLTGQRILNLHKELLAVQFRIDTVEAKTQALRDIVAVGIRLRLLKGVFLLMDELEKQDYSVSKTTLLRYLSAIRATIDAFPKCLFMMVALTPAARQRYSEMLPAFQGRLQNAVTLKPLLEESEALSLWRFYLNHGQEQARARFGNGKAAAGNSPLIGTERVLKLFTDLRQRSQRLTLEGVTQRDFLNALNEEAERTIAKMAAGANPQRAEG